MEAISHDQFKVKHLRQRIASLTVKHEDEVVEFATQLQLMTQERDDLRQHAGNLTAELNEKNAEIERLRALVEQQDEQEQDTDDFSLDEDEKNDD